MYYTLTHKNNIHNINELYYNRVTGLIDDILIDTVSIVIYDPTDHFELGGSNFLAYYLLRGFQRLEVILVHLSFEVASEKQNHMVSNDK